MALTKTRTRTQTTLTRLAQRLAETNDEMALCQNILASCDLTPWIHEAVSARLDALDQDRHALCETIRQFDPELDPETVGRSLNWFRTRCRKPESLRRAYLARFTSTRVTVAA
jgi:hypothetical protein